MKKMQGVLFAAFLLVVFSLPVLAHHSFSSEFDANKKISIDGVISKVELINPHGYVHLDGRTRRPGKSRRGSLKHTVRDNCAGWD